MTFNKLFRLTACVAFATALSACDSEGLDYPYGPIGQGNIEALVLNEGTASTNSGTISVLNKDGSVVPDAFRQANHRPMGDVAQSITPIHGLYFVALNNSKKIEIVDPSTFQSVGTILYTQAGWPRQIAAISDSEAVVSDLNRQLVRIRTQAPYGEPLEYIPIPYRMEYMAVAAGKLFGMTAYGLYVFDTDRLDPEQARCIPQVWFEESTKTCPLLTDKHGRIWALMNETDGGRQTTAVSLVCIDPHTETEVARHRLELNLSPEVKPGDPTGTIWYNRTAIDPTGTWIYFHVRTCRAVDNGQAEYTQTVYRMHVDNGKPEPYMDLPEVGMMYGFAVGPQGDVYLCDCLDYTAQRGYVRKYRPDGSVQSFRVGIYPSQVYFPRQ